MPAPAIVAGIQAAGTLGAAGIGARTAGQAARTQAKAGVRAEAHARGTEKRASQVDQRAWDDYRERHAAWEARRQAEAGGNTLTRPGVANPQRSSAPAAPGTMSSEPSRGNTLADLLGIDPSAAAMMPNAIPGAAAGPGAPPGRGRTLADILDWGNYGV